MESGSKAQSALVNRHSVLAFVVLAYVLSWWAWVWYRADPATVDAPIFPLGPFLAALILLPLLGGWAAVCEFFARILRWRVGWKWYAIALGLPVLITLCAVGLNLLLGARILPGFEVSAVADLAGRFVFIFLFIGLGEEPGWRGFLLPRILADNRPLAAALIVGAIHLIWHLPLFGVEYDTTNILPWGAVVICFSIMVCWIYLHTGGSVLLPMLMHASNNTVAIVWGMFEGGDQLWLWWIWSGLWVLVTLAVILAKGTDLGGVSDDRLTIRDR